MATVTLNAEEIYKAGKGQTYDYPPGTVIVIEAEYDLGFLKYEADPDTFTLNEGDVVTVSLWSWRGADRTAYFRGQYPVHTVTAVPSDASLGTVTGSPVSVQEGTAFYSSGNRLYVGTNEIIATPKASDIEASYTFTGWSPASGTVTADMTITAVFSSTPKADPEVNPGDTIGGTGLALGSHPRWIRWTGATAFGGTAALPSGSRRIEFINSSGVSKSVRVKVNPIPLPPTSAPWRAVIYSGNGSYIVMDGLGGVPCVGTPSVRLSDSAPSRAIVNLAVGRGAGNVRLPTYSGWSDGHAEMVKRGMELTVEYRDETTRNTVMVFRGQIYQISSGESVQITAYDRVMDLVQYSDQYQTSKGSNQSAESTARTESGSNIVYTMPTSVGTIVSASSVNMLSIDALAQMTYNTSGSRVGYVRHCLPFETVGGDRYEPIQGSTIIEVGTSMIQTLTIEESCWVRARVILYALQAGQFVEVASTSKMTATGTGQVERTFHWSVNWTLNGPASNYRIGAEYEAGGSSYYRTRGYKWSETRYTATSYQKSSNGSTWSDVADSEKLPEVAIKFSRNNGSLPVGSLTASGNTIIVPESLIPAPAGTYLSTLAPKGRYIVASYFSANSSFLMSIAEDLIRDAGLKPSVEISDNASTSYYTSSTFDYQTCVLELLKAGHYGLKPSDVDPGTVRILPKHTVDESPILNVSTAPGGEDARRIVSHDITAHWMAEKATVAYIAENTTSSGLPIALESDDALMDDSLVSDLGSPLRSVTADTTLGTHALLANTAGGKMVQLHTNVFEGSLTLAGYVTAIWDLFGLGAGGQPIGVEIPEYGASGVAVPTEVVFEDGVSKVKLDNIRTADRSEVANSMGLTADAISNTASSLPETVYIFARADTYNAQEYGLTVSPTKVEILTGSGTTLFTQTSATYIKYTEDAAGYGHVLAIMQDASAIAPSDPIKAVRINDGIWCRVDNPKFAYDGQTVHVDVRFKHA